MEEKMEKTVNGEIAEEKESAYCYECGCILDHPAEYTDPDGNPICEDCFIGNYFVCDHCGKLVRVEDGYVANDSMRDEEHVCEDCIEDDLYFQCDDCGNWYTDNHYAGFCHSRNGYDEQICSYCAEDHYVHCCNCDVLLNTNWGDAVAIDDEWYCEDCVENCQGKIHDYGFKPCPNFLSVTHCPDPNALYMGVELEIDNGDCVSDCARELTDFSEGESLFYLKHDSSLNEDGIEIVTHPATLKYHLTMFPWEEIEDTARKYSYRSHNTDTCGLHVHVSRAGLGKTIAEQEATIAKILLMADRFWDELVKFSRRDAGELCRWAEKPNVEIEEGDALRDAIDKVKAKDYSRYRAVNLRNRNTVEFRLFKGTLNVSTIKATLELVNVLCAFARNFSLERCLRATWKTVSRSKKYPELEEYLNSKRL